MTRWLECGTLVAGYLFLVGGYEVFAGHRTIGTLPSITAGSFLQLIVSPVVEEVFFRGLVLRETAAQMRGTFANLVTSSLFVGIHLPFWITHGESMQVFFTNAVGVFLFSLLAGWLYLRTRSVWPPAMAHIANNSLNVVLAFG